MKTVAFRRDTRLSHALLSSNGTLLYWRAPDYAPAHRKRRVEGLVQLPLFDWLPVEKVVGGNEISPSLRNRLRVISKPEAPNVDRL